MKIKKTRKTPNLLKEVSLTSLNWKEVSFSILVYLYITEKKKYLKTLKTLKTLLFTKKIFFFNWVNITIYVKSFSFSFQYANFKI